jgi:hypothetical protein
MTKLERLFPVFGAAFAVIYAVVLDYNWALFTYHPKLAIWDAGVAAPKDGPAMYWYGVVATSFLAALAVTAVIGLVVPENIKARAWSGLTWLLPVGSIAFLVWLLMPYFTK